MYSNHPEEHLSDLWHVAAVTPTSRSVGSSLIGNFLHVLEKAGAKVGRVGFKALSWEQRIISVLAILKLLRFASALESALLAIVTCFALSFTVGNGPHHYDKR